MLEPWKMMSLQPPPVQTTRLNKNIDVKELEHVCNNILRVLSKQSPLHKESALLSRFLYKYDRKFRNDIGFRNIRKINSTLKRYLTLNLYKDVGNFIAVLPQDDEDYLPTRQMLEYVLVRIMSFSKIMLRISVFSKQAAVFYFDRVKRGESHWMSLMPYALLCRVYSMCSVLLHHSSTWYTCLYRYLSHFQLKGLTFLPIDCNLPDDLEKWLDLKNIDNFGRFSWAQKKNANIDLSMLDDDECSAFDQILGYITKINEDNDGPDENTQEINERVSSKITNIVSEETFIRVGFPLQSGPNRDTGVAISRESLLLQAPEKNDHGEAVSRESISILNKFQKNLNDNKASHYFGKVTNLKTLTDFIDREETYRNDADNRSLTKHLSFMQWQTLKTSLLKVCDTLSKNRKVEKKLQKVWKEKCLDYV